MGRVGVSAADAPELAAAIDASRWLRIEGLMTHLAVADEPARDATTAEQIDRFEGVRDALARAGTVAPLLHAANSAGALAHPSARYDLVRCGIAIYGYPPVPLPDGTPRLRPAMALRAEVSLVKSVASGTPLSYGHRYAAANATTIATVPLGYADGVRRSLWAAGAHVLIGGRLRPMAGTVTMDQLLVDCGPDADVAVGDEVVLLGQQADLEITAHDWAQRLDTIAYEVLCAIAPRVPRRYLHSRVQSPRNPGALYSRRAEQGELL
jgi:alanine racemase